MSLAFINEIYNITKNFLTNESYGLTSQMRRASVSIASNIAEGSAKSTTKEFLRFIDMSFASIAEIDTQLEISRMQAYIPDKKFSELILRLQSIERMLGGLKKSLINKLTPLTNH